MKPRLRPLAEELRALPNLITLARIASLPVVLLLVDNYSRARSFAAALVFVAGGLSDVIDGAIARKRGLVTVLGQFLDPLADKLFVLGTLVWLVARDRVPEWLVVVLMSRELAITGLRAVASGYGLVIAASPGGKTKTAFQTIGIVCLLIHFRYHLLVFDTVIDFHLVGTYLLFASLAMSLWSAGEYVRVFVRAADAKHKRALQDDADEARAVAASGGRAGGDADGAAGGSPS
jgi:CDP-diacylglycerol--glycerol-3-phosphate 3-phosphatidyltransferase